MLERITEAKQALRKAHNSVAPLRSIMTFYTSKSRGAGWCEEQEKSSHPYYSTGGTSKKEFLHQPSPWEGPRRELRDLVEFIPRPPNGYPQNIRMDIKGSPMLKRPKPIRTPIKFLNKNKYYDSYEDYRHTTYERRELKKALQELADQGQLNRFLRRGRCGDHNRNNQEGKTKNDADRNIEIITNIIGGINDK
ncbi:hypothetical protein Cgig2_005890 [Carnegiea gigantea]|uniref:Uncharacterized protein n=1 Tax=Carnegiea gigantea TaxID=171969 RepID=A0A9Q1JPW7_9CARY|nr:hypothetical protein Cgig2_005890 [Carnegiea gigantea]